MKKIEYTNNAKYPENLQVLEDYVIEIIKNQNEIIEKLEEQIEDENKLRNKFRD